MSKNTKWMRYRHRVVRNIVYVLLYPYTRIKYGITIERLKEKPQRQYLILINHQTPFDQFFVGMAFKGPIYYLATEDLFSNGFVSKLIRYLVAPIPIKKQTADIRAIINCMKVVGEGGTVAIAPEGNRTYSGKTEYINPTIAALARKMNLPIAFFRIEGGYGAQPRWSDVVRKGKMKAYISHIAEPEEYAKLSDSELNDLICKELYVNEAEISGEFRHKRLAEYLERAVYVCDKCGLSVFESNRDEIRCTKCGRTVKYLPTKELKGVGFDFPFRFVNDWYEYQCDFVNSLNTNDYTDSPMFTDIANVSEVIINKNKVPVYQNATVALYGNRIVINENSENEMVFPFETLLAVTVLGRNKLNIYSGKKVYQLKGGKRFNALKYVNIFNRSKNIAKGDINGKFLGL